MKQRKKWIIAATMFLVLVAGWVAGNPPSRFGVCAFACTTYNCLPRPISDLQIRANGDLRTIEKTHTLALDKIQWLLEGDAPDVLIISLGWDEKVAPSAEIQSIDQCKVILLQNEEATEAYNKLKREGVRVAIHYHSTC